LAKHQEFGVEQHKSEAMLEVQGFSYDRARASIVTAENGLEDISESNEESSHTI
jgi:hypothetical protein